MHYLMELILLNVMMVDTMFLFIVPKTTNVVLLKIGKADKLVLANHPEVTPFLDKYLSSRPYGADPDFYLQEVEEEFGNIF